MNNSVLVSSHTSSSTPPSTALDLGLVLGPHSDPRSWFETWIQPWLGIIGMADNLVCVIIFGPILSGWCACGSGRGVHVKGGGVSLVSRIYYVVISVAELFNVGAGYILRNTITYLPFAVSIWLIPLLGGTIEKFTKKNTLDILVQNSVFTLFTLPFSHNILYL